MKKRLICIVCTLLFVVGLAGCKGCKKNPSPENPPVETQAELLISAEKLDMIVGDSVELTAYNYTKQDGVSVEYSSSAPAVAEVDSEGNVLANTKGTATITVTYGTQQKTCEVNVGFGGMVPKLDFKQVVGSDVSLPFGGSLNLEGVVLFNGKEYDDVEITYTFSGSVGEIVANKNQFLANQSTGTGVIKAVASWRGMDGATVKTLQKEITVHVIHTVSIVTNFNYYTLYPVAAFDGKTYETDVDLTVKVYENQTEMQYESIRVKAGSEEIISLNPSTLEITATKFGVGIIQIEYVDSFNETHIKEIEIKVERPIKTLQTVIDVSAMDGTLPLTDLFGKEVSLLNAYQDGNELTLSQDGQTVSGLRIEENKVTNSTLLIYDNEVGYEFPVNIYKKVLKTASDFSVFNQAGKLTGYYYLANDITDYGNVGHFKSPSSSSCFAGIFDGGGHSANLTITTNRGLFVYLNAATIKNVQFNLKIKPANTSDNYHNMAGLASSLWTNVSMVDVNVRIVEIANNLVGTFSPISKDIPKSILFTRTVVEMPNAEYFTTNGLDESKISALGNSICGYDTTSGVETVNWNSNLSSDVFVISHLPLARSIWESYKYYAFTVYASNVTKTMDSVNKTTYLGQTRNSKGYQLCSYASTAELIAKAHDLTSYAESGYWNTSTGAPVWTGNN